MPDSRLNEGEVYFALRGDFDPTSLSVGIAPTRVRLKSSPTPKQSWWIYSSGKVRNELVDVYAMASALVAALAPCAAAIEAARALYGLEAVLEVVLTFSPHEQASTPAIGFEPEVLAFLSRVGASIDIDTYVADPANLND